MQVELNHSRQVRLQNVERQMRWMLGYSRRQAEKIIQEAVNER